MGYRIESESASVAKNAVVANAWTIIRRDIGALDLGPKWEKAYHARSITVHNRGKGYTVKVTLDGQVFVDELVGKGEFKSSKFDEPDMAAACATARTILLAMN